MEQTAPDLPQLSAMTLAGVSDALRSLIALGGPVVAILLAVSVLGLAVILLKLAQFLPALRPPRRRLEWALSAWRSGRQADGVDMFGRLPGAAARIAAFTARQLLDEGDGPNVRERVELAAREEVAGLRSYLRVLEVVAQIAPLLGLLGTIIGMIEAFKVMAAAGGSVDPSSLAGGIWVALLTTAVGLSVALPAVVAGNLFDGVVERERQHIEAVATQLLTTWRVPTAVRSLHPVGGDTRRQEAVIHAG